MSPASTEAKTHAPALVAETGASDVSAPPLAPPATAAPALTQDAAAQSPFKVRRARGAIRTEPHCLQIMVRVLMLAGYLMVVCACRPDCTAVSDGDARPGQDKSPADVPLCGSSVPALWRWLDGKSCAHLHCAISRTRTAIALGFRVRSTCVCVCACVCVCTVLVVDVAHPQHCGFRQASAAGREWAWGLGTLSQQRAPVLTASAALPWGNSSPKYVSATHTHTHTQPHTHTHM